jgi:hypothetical protein
MRSLVTVSRILRVVEGRARKRDRRRGDERTRSASEATPSLVSNDIRFGAVHCNSVVSSISTACVVEVSEAAIAVDQHRELRQIHDALDGVTTCVHDASFASRWPRREQIGLELDGQEIDSPDAHTPRKPARSAIAPDRPSCASTGVTSALGCLLVDMQHDFRRAAWSMRRRPIRPPSRRSSPRLSRRCWIASPMKASGPRTSCCSARST